MKLCTFEVRTHLGKHQRIGAVVSEGIVDLNFACALDFSARGEARPYEMAGVLVPPSMLEFLRGGAASMDAARSAVEDLRGTFFGWYDAYRGHASEGPV